MRQYVSLAFRLPAVLSATHHNHLVNAQIQLLFRLFCGCIMHCWCYFSTCTATTCTDQWISSSFSSLYPTIDSLTLNSQPAALYLMCEWSSPKWTYFLCEAQHALYLGTWGSTSAVLGGTLNSKVTNKNYQDLKSVALSRWQKDHLFTVWALKREGRASSCSTLAGNVHVGWLRFFTSLPLSENDCRDAPSIALGVRINLSEEVNSHAWSPQIMRNSCS